MWFFPQGLRTMTHGLDRRTWPVMITVKLSWRVNHLDERSYHLKVIIWTDRQTHTPIASLDSKKWSVIKQELISFSGNVDNAVFVLYWRPSFTDRLLWAHSPLRAAARRLFYIAVHQVSLLSHAACASMSTTESTNNDNAWQRGPLWPHGMGPIIYICTVGCFSC